MVVVTGGLGCAPVVAVINYILMRRERFGRLTIVQGVKHAEDLIWRERYAYWRGLPGVQVLIAADQGGPLWPHHVGLVTEVFDRVDLTPRTRGDAVRARADDASRPRACWLRAACSEQSIWLSMERNMQCAVEHCGHCQFGARFRLPQRTGVRLSAKSSRCSAGGASEMSARPRVAVHKFSSCDGCQLAFLNLGEALLAGGRAGGLRPLRRSRAGGSRRGCGYRLRRGQHLHAGGYRAHPARARQQRTFWSPSARARRPAASRRCATCTMAKQWVAGVYASPQYVEHARARHADRRASQGGSGAVGLSGERAPDPRRAARTAFRRRAARGGGQGLHGVQAAADRVRAW